MGALNPIVLDTGHRYCGEASPQP